MSFRTKIFLIFLVTVLASAGCVTVVVCPFPVVVLSGDLASAWVLAVDTVPVPADPHALKPQAAAAASITTRLPTNLRDTPFISRALFD